MGEIITMVGGGASLLIGSMLVYLAVLAAGDAWRWRSPIMVAIALVFLIGGLTLIGLGLVGLFVAATPETAAA